MNEYSKNKNYRYTHQESSFRKTYRFSYKFVIDVFAVFCKGTSLHGFSQFYDFHSTGKRIQSKLFQKLSTLLWISIVSFAITFQAYLMHIVIQRYHMTPTITVIATSNNPVSTIAFPGVAICNSNLVWKPNTKNVINKLLSFNVSEIDIYNFLGNLSALTKFSIVDERLMNIMDILEQKFNYTSDSLMKELAQPCKRMIRFCKWLTRKLDCDLIFRLAKTELGYCCTFNYKADRASKERFTDQELLVLNKPEVRISGAGEDIGIRVFVRIDEKEYISANKYFPGVEVIVFDPYDFPEKAFISSVSQPGSEVAIGVKPVLSDTNEELRKFSVEERGCRYQSENKENFTMSTKYSNMACMAECRAIHFIEICNCLPYFYPKNDYLRNETTLRWCSMRDNPCLYENKHEFFSTPLAEDDYSIFNESVKGLVCSCSKSCRENFYFTETFYMQRMNRTHKRLRDSEVDLIDSDDDILGFVKVYYKQLSMLKYERKIYMSWDSLLASIGGIYGFCLGGSLLSIIQIIYYFTLKALEIYLNNKRELKENEIKTFFQFYKTDFRKPSIINVSIR